MSETRVFGQPELAVPGAPVLVHENVAQGRFSITPGKVAPFYELPLENGWQAYSAPNVGKNVVGRWGPFVLVVLAIDLAVPGSSERLSTVPEDYKPSAITTFSMRAYELKSSRINVPYGEN